MTDRGDPDNCAAARRRATLPRTSQTKTVSISVAKTGCFTDDSQSDFAAGTTDQCDLTSTPGDVKLSFGESVDQSNETPSRPSAFEISPTTWAGQTFTPSRTGEVTKVDVNLSCPCVPDPPPPDVTVSIRATSGGLPTGADLASGTIASFSENRFRYRTATFASPITLTAGTQYALLVRPNAEVVNSLSYWIPITDGDSYPGGTRVDGAAGGTAWSFPGRGSDDIGFHIWYGTGYAPGSFVSSVKDAAPAAGSTPTWTTLSFDATTPANTGVKFQVAASNSSTGSFTFVGPDGTPGTFFTTSGADLSRFDGFRYLKYKAFLSTTDGSATPSLQSVRVCFKDIPAQ